MTDDMNTQSSHSQAQFDELKDIITETLEKRGVLAKIQSQLRKHVFSALIFQENKEKSSSVTECDSPPILTDEYDQIVLALIRDFLTYHHLDYTLSLMNTECANKLQEIQSITRNEIASKLNLGAQKPQAHKSLLKILVSKTYETDIFKPRGSIISDDCKLKERKSNNSYRDSIESLKRVNNNLSLSSDSDSESINFFDKEHTTWNATKEMEEPKEMKDQLSFSNIKEFLDDNGNEREKEKQSPLISNVSTSITIDSELENLSNLTEIVSVDNGTMDEEEIFVESNEDDEDFYGALSESPTKPMSESDIIDDEQVTIDIQSESVNLQKMSDIENKNVQKQSENESTFKEIDAEKNFDQLFNENEDIFSSLMNFSDLNSLNSKNSSKLEPLEIQKHTRNIEFAKKSNITETEKDVVFDSLEELLKIGGNSIESDDEIEVNAEPVQNTDVKAVENINIGVLSSIATESEYDDDFGSVEDEMQMDIDEEIEEDITEDIIEEEEDFDIDNEMNADEFGFQKMNIYQADNLVTDTFKLENMADVIFDVNSNHIQLNVNNKK